MNKFLRYSLSLVLAFVASVTFAGTTPYKVLTFPDEGTEGKTISSFFLNMISAVLRMI